MKIDITQNLEKVMGQINFELKRFQMKVDENFVSQVEKQIEIFEQSKKVLLKLIADKETFLLE